MDNNLEEVVADDKKIVSVLRLKVFKSMLETLIEGYVQDVMNREDAQDLIIEKNSNDIKSIFTILDNMSGEEGGASSDLAEQLAGLRKLLEEFAEVEDISDWIDDVNSSISSINTAIAAIGVKSDGSAGKFITGVNYDPTTKKFTISRGSIAKSDLPTLNVNDIDYSNVTDDNGAASSFEEAVQKVSPPVDFSGLTQTDILNGNTKGASGVVVQEVTQSNGKTTVKYKKLSLADMPSGLFGTDYAPWNTAITSLVNSINAAVEEAFHIGDGHTPNENFEAVYNDVQALKTVINEFTPEGESESLTNAINTIREVYAFLAQYSDNQTLAGILMTLESNLKGFAASTAEEKAAAAKEAAVEEAKNYTDGQIGNLNSDGNPAGRGEVVTNVTQSGGTLSVEKRAMEKEDIPNIDISQVNGLRNALNNMQDLLVFATDDDIRDIFAADTNSMVSLANVEE